jgi:hypothetical protein
MEFRPKKSEQSVKDLDERRKALKAIGKFGLYTAPTFLALLKSGRAHASGPTADAAPAAGQP